MSSFFKRETEPHPVPEERSIAGHLPRRTYVPRITSVFLVGSGSNCSGGVRRSYTTYARYATPPITDTYMTLHVHRKKPALRVGLEGGGISAYGRRWTDWRGFNLKKLGLGWAQKGWTAVGRYEDVNVRREVVLKIKRGVSQGNLMGYLITIFVAIVMARGVYFKEKKEWKERKKGLWRPKTKDNEDINKKIICEILAKENMGIFR